VGALLLLVAVPGRAAQWTAIDSSTSQQLNGIWMARDGSDGIAVGNGGTVVHFDGSAWSAMTPAPQTSADLLDVWGRPKQGTQAYEYVVSGQGVVLYHDGAQWHFVQQGQSVPYTPVWIPEVGDRMYYGAPGQFNTLLPFNVATLQPAFGQVVGGRFTLAFCDRNYFGDPQDDFLFVLDRGDILQSPATPVFSMPAGQTMNLVAAWFDPLGCDALVGIDSLSQVYEFDFIANEWSSLDAEIPDTLLWVTGTSLTNLYAGGFDAQNEGVVWHYDGAAWQQETVPEVAGLIDGAVSIRAGEEPRRSVADGRLALQKIQRSRQGGSVEVQAVGENGNGSRGVDAAEPIFDASITKEVLDTEAVVGRPVRYRLTVENPGNTPLSPWCAIFPRPWPIRASCSRIADSK
jgi:hypothetical protein